MMSPVNISIGFRPYFPAVHEYISASQTRKIPYAFWYHPPYSSTLILVLDYFYHPFGSVMTSRVWFCFPNTNATETCAFM